MKTHKQMAKDLHLEYLKDSSCFVEIVSDALNQVVTEARNDALEEAAKVVENWDSPDTDFGDGLISLQDAIRSLKDEKPSKKCEHIWEHKQGHMDYCSKCSAEKKPEE